MAVPNAIGQLYRYFPVHFIHLVDEIKEIKIIINWQKCFTTCHQTTNFPRTSLRQRTVPSYRHLRLSLLQKCHIDIPSATFNLHDLNVSKFSCHKFLTRPDYRISYTMPDPRIHGTKRNYIKIHVTVLYFSVLVATNNDWSRVRLKMWANAQRDSRPAEHRWRPLFNAAKFG